MYIVYANGIKLMNIEDYQICPMRYDAEKGYFKKSRFDEADIFKMVGSRFSFTFKSDMALTPDIALAEKIGEEKDIIRISIPYETWWYLGWVNSDIAKMNNHGKSSYILPVIRNWCENCLHYALIPDNPIPKVDYSELLLDGLTYNQALQKMQTMMNGPEKDALKERINMVQAHIRTIFPDYTHPEEDRCRS